MNKNHRESRACSISQGGALKDSSHKTSHCFPRRDLTQKGLWSVAPISFCQAWSLSHIRHTTDRQTGAYRTLNKRGHIPGVFPHEDTSCSGGEEWDNWGSAGDWPRATLPLPKVLSALFVFFFCSVFTIFILQSISTTHSASHSPHPSLWVCQARSEALVC